MQKKVIALAVAALASGAAFAQTSGVTISGTAAAEYFSATTTNAVAGSVKNMRGVVDNQAGSRLTFTSDEDLGNGLTAGMVYMLGISFDQNAATTTVPGAAGAATDQNLTNFFTRMAYVRLDSKQAGEVALGRFQTLGYFVMADARPWGGWDPLRTAGNSLGYMTSNTSERYSNAIRYQSPSFAGFQLQGMYTADARSGLSAADRNIQVQDYNNDTASVAGQTVYGRQQAYQLGAKYDNGPISVGSFYKNQSKPDGYATATPEKKQEFGLRGSYDLGVVKLGASYQRVTLADAVTLNTPTSGNQQFKSGYFYSGYARAPIGSQFVVSLEAAKANGDASQGSYGYTFIGEYLFSKRTKAYLEVGYAKMNSANAAARSMGTFNLPVEAGKSVSGAMLGLQHNF